MSCVMSHTKEWVFCHAFKWSKNANIVTSAIHWVMPLWWIIHLTNIDDSCPIYTNGPRHSRLDVWINVTFMWLMSHWWVITLMTLTSGWLMSYWWMPHVTHNEWFILRVWMIHVTRIMIQVTRTYVWFNVSIWLIHVTYMNDSCRPHDSCYSGEWFVLLIWMVHGIRMNDWFCAYEWLTSHKYQRFTLHTHYVYIYVYTYINIYIYI